MKAHLATLLVGVVVGSGAALGWHAQNSPPPDGPAYSAVTPNHQWLTTETGQWNVEVRSWATPETAPTTRTYKIGGGLDGGGRFCIMRTFGSAGANAYTGFRVIGFNNSTGRYEMVIWDSLGTGITRATGTREDGVITWDVDTFRADGTPIHLRGTETHPNADEWTLTLHTVDTGGATTKVEEWKHTRVPRGH